MDKSDGHRPRGVTVRWGVVAAVVWVIVLFGVLLPLAVTWGQ